MPDTLNETPRTISVPGTLRVLERLNPYEFRVQIDIMLEGLNNNRWDYRNHHLGFQQYRGCYRQQRRCDGGKGGKSGYYCLCRRGRGENFCCLCYSARQYLLFDCQSGKFISK